MRFGFLLILLTTVLIASLSCAADVSCAGDSDESAITTLLKAQDTLARRCETTGRACRSHSDCDCGFCTGGICGGSGHGSCRPAGAGCTEHSDCCGFCNYPGVCD